MSVDGQFYVRYVRGLTSLEMGQGNQSNGFPARITEHFALLDLFQVVIIITHTLTIYITNQARKRLHLLYNIQ
jgi:hypothetical protein